MPDVKKLALDLKALITEQPHIQQVYLLANGSYSLNAYSWNGALYSRIDPSAVKGKNAVAAQAQYKIVATITREDILKTAAQFEEQPAAEEKAEEHEETKAPEDTKQPEKPLENVPPVLTGTPSAPAPETTPAAETTQPTETTQATQN
jgi:hypothetical protein